MTDPIAFLLASLALLAAPGPTNALLAAAGASGGLAGAWRLVAAVVAGYAVSITTLAAVVGPVALRTPALDVALRVACGLWLTYTAVSLWRGGRGAEGAPLVGAGRVFVTTLLNPKGAVVAVALLPHLAQGRWREAAPYGLALAGVIATVSAGWAGVGASLRTSAREAVVRRVSAGVMVVFALILARGAALSAR